MKKEILQTISQEFKQLIPQDELTILLLVSLHLKIQHGFIEEPFSQKDFDDTIDEVAELLQREKDIQKEGIAKKIRKYFFVAVKGTNPYELTVFTKDFCELIIAQVRPIVGKLELYHTFKRTLPMNDGDIINLDTLNHWFEHNFKPARKTIQSHIEDLYRFVDEKLIELRQLLKPEIQDPRQLIDDFLKVFEELGEQTNEIINTLTHKQEIFDKIKSVESLFEEDKYSYEGYIQLRLQVEHFFESIDNRIIAINERIHFASSRLKNLYETLKHKNQYKVFLEKFLMYLIRNSQNIKGEFVLPSNIEKKFIPAFKSRLVSIPVLNFTNISQHEIPNYEEDTNYRKEIEAENYKILEQQENVSKWLDIIHNKVETGEVVNFDELFSNIRKEEQNIEVPVDVCSNIIQQTEDKAISIIISKNEPVFNEDIALWKMKIKRSTF